MKTKCEKTVMVEGEEGEEAFTQGKEYEVGVIVSSGRLVLGAINNSGTFHRILTTTVHPADSEFFHKHFKSGSLR